MSVQNNTCYCFIKGINGLVEYNSCCNMNTKRKTAIFFICQLEI